MKNNILNKILAVLTVIIIVFCFSTTVAFAESAGSIATDTTVGEDIKQGVKTEYDNIQVNNQNKIGTEVYLTNDTESVLVSVPKKVIVSGVPDTDNLYKGKYKVKVDGDFAGNKTVSVMPDYNVVLKQTGKNDARATITQDKSSFSYQDVIGDNNIGNGVISAKSLTAGSWNGIFNFNINLIEHFVYYSSLEKAVLDANNLTYDNADIKIDDMSNAVAALSISNDNKAYIRLINDANNVQSITLNNDTTLNLNNHTLTFSKECGLLSNNNLDIYNGYVKGSDSNYLIETTNNKLNVNNVNFEQTVSSSLNSTAFIIHSNSTVNNIIESSFNIIGRGNPQKSVVIAAIYPEDSVNNIDNSQFNINVEYCSNSKCLQLQGNASVTNNNFNIVNKEISGYAGAITNSSYSNNKSKIKLKDSTIKIRVDSGKSNGVSTRCDLFVEGVKIDVGILNNAHGMGLGVFGDGDLTINSTAEHPVNIFGSQWGIQTSPLGNTTIHGGVYTSANHTGYIQSHADIYDAQFYIDQSEKYPNKSGCFGLYFGGRETTPGKVVNMYNCIIGNPNKIKQEYNSALCATANWNQNTIHEINLYNCDVYKGSNLFGFSFYNESSQEQKLSEAKFNIYEGTRLFDNNKREITKEQFKKGTEGWKTQKYFKDWSGDTGISKHGLGNGYIYSYCLWDMDNDRFVKHWMTEDTDVYDYRL